MSEGKKDRKKKREIEKETEELCVYV